MRFVYAIPIGGTLLGLAALGSIGDMTSQRPAPESVILNDPSDYQTKAKDYAELDREPEALDTCAAMAGKYSESDQDICFLNVYEVLDDIDGEIEVHEKWLAKDLADGDSGALGELVLKGLREERDKRK